eukprot:6181453-Pleurochrysis_carterae.AAC.1
MLKRSAPPAPTGTTPCEMCVALFAACAVHDARLTLFLQGRYYLETAEIMAAMPDRAQSVIEQAAGRARAHQSLYISRRKGRRQPPLTCFPEFRLGATPSSLRFAAQPPPPPFRSRTGSFGAAEQRAQGAVLLHARDRVPQPRQPRPLQARPLRRHEHTLIAQKRGNA